MIYDFCQAIMNDINNIMNSINDIINDIMNDKKGHNTVNGKIDYQLRVHPPTL